MKLTLMLSLFPTTWSPRLTNHHSEHMTRLDLKWFHLCCSQLDYCVAPTSSVSPLRVVSDIILAHSVLTMSLEFSQLMWAQLLRTFYRVDFICFGFLSLTIQTFWQNSTFNAQLPFQSMDLVWPQAVFVFYLCCHYLKCFMVGQSPDQRLLCFVQSGDCCVTPPLALGQAATVGNVVLPQTP